jgi:hypothetical protein
MMEKAESRSTRSHRLTGEAVGAWATIGLFLAVWIVAYAFAVNGWNIAGDRPHEADIATGWQELGAPTEIDVAKRR